MPHIGWAKLDCLSIICSKILLSGTWKHLHVWSPLPLWPCLLFSPFFNMAWPLTYLCSLVSLLSLTFTLVSCRYWSSFCFSSQPIFCFLHSHCLKCSFSSLLLFIITFFSWPSTLKHQYHQYYFYLLLFTITPLDSIHFILFFLTLQNYQFICLFTWEQGSSLSCSLLYLRLNQNW